MPEIGEIEVCWIRNPPRAGERYPVKTITEANGKINHLARLDLRDKRVWGNVGGIVVWDGKEWVDWMDDDGNTLEDIERDLDKGETLAMRLSKIDEERKSGKHRGF